MPTRNFDQPLRFRPLVRTAWVIGSPLMALGLAGCLATSPTVGGGSKGAVSGATAGASAEGASGELEHCPTTLGTLAVVEDQGAGWYTYYYSHYGNLGSTVPVLRMMIQQSNCFVVVERGRAMRNLEQERQLERSGEMRAGSNFGAGQMVAADYTMSPSIQFNQNTGGVNAAISGLRSVVGGVLGSVAGNVKQNEAATTLIMIDNRSGVQLAAAEGSARAYNFGGWTSAYGWATAGAAGAYTRTPEGKIIVAAFVDSYNQLVKAVRNYRPQTVKGGLGTGGALGVDGGAKPPAGR